MCRAVGLWGRELGCGVVCCVARQAINYGTDGAAGVAIPSMSAPASGALWCCVTAEPAMCMCQHMPTDEPDMTSTFRLPRTCPHAGGIQGGTACSVTACSWPTPTHRLQIIRHDTGRPQGWAAHQALRLGAGIGAGAAVEGELLQDGHKGLRGGVHARAAMPLPLRALQARHGLPLPLWEQRGALLVLHGILARHPTCLAGAGVQAGRGAGGLAAMGPGPAGLLWTAGSAHRRAAAPAGAGLAAFKVELAACSAGATRHMARRAQRPWTRPGRWRADGHRQPLVLTGLDPGRPQSPAAQGEVPSTLGKNT